MINLSVVIPCYNEASAIPLLIEKYKTNLARIYDGDKQKKIIDLCLDYDKFAATPVNEFMDLLAL